MSPAVRIAAALSARGLAGVGAMALRALIVGAVVAALWPFIAVAGRRLAPAPPP